MDLTKYPKNEAGLPIVPLSDYNKAGRDYRSVWSTERTDMADWEQVRHRYMGKRTLMVYCCTLEIEDMGFVIDEKL